MTSLEWVAEAARLPDTPGPVPLPDDFWPRFAAAPTRDYGELQPSGYAGYVVDCLEAAVCCALGEPTVEESLVTLVNLAGETDTMAAVAGGACGVLAGVESLPERWLEVLHERGRLEDVGRKLAVLRHQLVYRKPNLPAFEFAEAGVGLLAGRNPLTGEDVGQLLEQGVTAVIDLREEKEWAEPGRYGRDAVAAFEWCGVERLHLPILDTGDPRGDDFDRACHFLDAALAHPGAKAYVHCRAGLERTGAVLVAYRARREGLGYEDALARVREAGAWVRPLPGQEREVERWLAERT